MTDSFLHSTDSDREISFFWSVLETEIMINKKHKAPTMAKGFIVDSLMDAYVLDAKEIKKVARITYLP
jgi:hypothetical protein